MENYLIDYHLHSSHYIQEVVLPFSFLSMAIMPPPIPIQSLPIYFQVVIKPRLLRCLGSQCMPHVHDACSASRQHAILEAVEILSVDGRHEFAGCETEEYSG
jgi:hypothetical protein